MPTLQPRARMTRDEEEERVDLLATLELVLTTMPDIDDESTFVSPSSTPNKRNEDNAQAPQ
jgi:hypothetical protein